MTEAFSGEVEAGSPLKMRARSDRDRFGAISMAATRD
jgi:hypothetical protein